MQRRGVPYLAALAALLIVAPSVPRTATADDSGQTSTEIVGPLDSVACDATPPTISIQGIVIDVTNADFCGGSCAALTAGQVVEVQLDNNSPPTATEVCPQDTGDSGDGTSQDGQSGSDSGSSDSGNGSGSDS